MFDEDLAVYDGDDRVVKSYEAVRLIEETGGSEFKVWAGPMFPSVDLAMDGFQGGELITISGSTKNGKTLMAQSLTMAFAEQKKPPLWFTFEVTPSQFFKRFPSIPRITIPLRLRHHDMNWIEDRIVESLLKYGTRIAFIDHLHYLVDMAGSRNISIDIGMVIRRLKGICVERDMVIFLLCHTTKDNARLSYSSIRDSSFVSQESDSVIMVSRDPAYNENAAVMTVEFHRRTGVMRRGIALMKVGEMLEEDPRRRIKLKDLNEEED
jgi:replicative DNA helicase